MNYIVSTFFDEEDWNKFGLNWVRNAKSASLDAIIIGKDLPEDAIAKIAELNFLYFPVLDKFKKNCNAMHTLVCNLPKNSRCLWTKPEILPKAGIIGEADLICGLSESPISKIVSSVINLYDRAAMIESLSQHIESVHNKYLSANYMLGTTDFWNGFFGCKSYLHERGYLVENSEDDDLVLNFFVAFAHSFSVEIKDYC
jgi:hypothetical protein